MHPRDAENERLRADNQALRDLVTTLTSTIEAQKSAFEDQRAAFEELLQRFQQLERRFLGKKSEKMPSPRDASRKRRGEKADPAKTQKKRKARAEQRSEFETVRVEHAVPDAQRCCPHCNRTDLARVGNGRVTKLLEYVPGYFVCEEHVQETLACACGDYIVTAPPPPKVFEGARYGPHFIAHLIVAKCVDSIPLHRLEKRFERLGIPMSRSTMTDLFHRAAEELAPLVERLFVMIALATVVQADETSIKIQDREKRGFIWTFVTADAIGYRCSPDRSGETPKQVLGGTEGVLVVDGYTGYNQVAGVDGRIRAGCLAHARRKFFESLDVAPEAQEALDQILTIYEVEYEAEELGIIGTGDHLVLRKQKSVPRMAKFHAWLVEQKSLHPPRGKMGKAIGYALRGWEALTAFLDDARAPVDNNRSEAALRIAALGRKNFLFVGHPEAGCNLAGLYSLMATCRLHGVNPEAYLADVLMRVGTHPAAEIDDLLPHRWISTG